MEAGQPDQSELKFSVSTQTPSSFCATRTKMARTAREKPSRDPVGPGQASWLSRVGEGSPTLCQTCTTALQALVRVVYLLLMLRLLRGGVRGRWCGFKRNPPSCWAFGCQTAKPLSNERPNRPPSPATDSQN